MKSTTSSIILCAALSISGAAQAVGFSYTITDLGMLPGSTATQAYGLNNSGQIVGYSKIGSAAYPFLYSSGSMTNIGTGGFATNINDIGQVVGLTSGPQRAFIYSNGTLTTLGTPGSFSSAALSINNSGQVVGWVNDANSVSSSFLYSEGVMTGLNWGGAATDINNSGQITGWQFSGYGPGYGRHAVVYSGGSLTDIGTLGSYESFASAINDLGQVVGHVSGGSQAFLYENGVMKGLGWSGDAKDINNSGLIVGELSSYSSKLRAVLYHDGAVDDLNNLIPSGSGWDLLSAKAINDKGQITGYGDIGGQTHSFLLTPTGGCPEFCVNGFSFNVAASGHQTG